VALMAIGAVCQWALTISTASGFGSSSAQPSSSFIQTLVVEQRWCAMTQVEGGQAPGLIGDA